MRLLWQVCQSQRGMRQKNTKIGQKRWQEHEAGLRLEQERIRLEQDRHRRCEAEMRQQAEEESDLVATVEGAHPQLVQYLNIRLETLKKELAEDMDDVTETKLGDLEQKFDRRYIIDRRTVGW